jgi:hypothetical protein
MVEARIEELMQEGDVQKDSFVVYEVKGKKVGAVETKVTLKAA